MRAIDNLNAWLFGTGKSSYVRGNDAVAQNIKTRLQSFLGDCFFDSKSGIDWFNLLGGKDENAISLSVSTIILNTLDVLSIKSINVTLDDDRNLTIEYSVESIYGDVSDIFEFDIGA